MKKKLKKVPSAGTKADSSTKDEDMQGSHAIANPTVVGSQSQVHKIKNSFTNKDDFWIEYTSKSPPVEKQ